MIGARPEVFNHNIETVRRLHRRMRGAKASYDKALWLLRRAKEIADYPVLTKSGIVGLETNEEVVETMRDLRTHGADVVTIGQYLQPSSQHAKIDRWVHPDEFAWMREQGEALRSVRLRRPARALQLPGRRAAPRGRDGPRRRRLLTAPLASRDDATRYDRAMGIKETVLGWLRTTPTRTMTSEGQRSTRRTASTRPRRPTRRPTRSAGRAPTSSSPTSRRRGKPSSVLHGSALASPA